MLKPHVFALLLYFTLSPSFAQNPPPPPSSSVKPSLQDWEKMSDNAQELQKMSNSMQRINTLFSTCKMQTECILAGLQEMHTKEQDIVAKMMLEEFEKQQKITMQSFEACFEQEKTEVMTALSHCIPPSIKTEDKDASVQCFESTLISLTEQGNSFAELTLIQFYKDQNNTAKAAEWEQKKHASQNVNREEHLKKCLQDKK